MKSDEPTDGIGDAEGNNATEQVDLGDEVFRLGQSRASSSSSETESAASDAQDEPDDRNGRQNVATESSLEEEEFDDVDDLQDGFTHEGRDDEFEADDPLGPGYDLDRGTLLTHTPPLEVLPHRSRIRNPKEFFSTEILYRYDILEDAERTALRGSYRIELRGYQGGVWTLVLGDSLEVVNRREDAEIVLSMQQRDFLQLVNGQLNPQLAIFAQKLRITGDLKKGILFQSLLTPQTD